ncbi:MAG: hypothetical protein ACRDVK_08410 [Acidimicrobiia bacterium]
MIAALAGIDPAEISRLSGLVDIDEVPVRRAPRWMTKAWRGEVGAMTLPWGIFVRGDFLAGDRSALAQLIKHELIHVRQWQELGPRRFLVRYLTEYLRLRGSGLGHQQAYEQISFEREARQLAGS